MREEKKWQSLCCKITYDGLIAYPWIKKELCSSKGAEQPQHCRVQSIVFGHEEKIMLFGYVVC
jgi:hypothetical protein